MRETLAAHSTMAYRYTFTALKTQNDSETNPVVRLPSCPICEIELSATAATESSDFPFCSERCRQVDLLRWSDGKYAIVEPLSADKIAEKQFEDELDEQNDDSGY